jgi:mannose-6-phosphate isomerase-like protein (cupin superfamily)
MELDVRHAVVLGPGEGEITADKPQRTTRIKAGLDAITVTEMRHEAGVRGPDVHIHRRHTDAFYVLEGTVTFVLGPDQETLAAPAGSFVAAPPGVVHTFRNDGAARSRLLNIHAPSERFHDHLREVRDGIRSDWFDQEDPPEDGGRPLSDAVVQGPGEGELIEVARSSLLIKGTAEGTDGQVFLSDSTVQAGFPGPPPHVHRELHDLFYVLDGTLTLRDGDESVAASPGTFACFPPGAVHTFANESDEPVRFLNFNTPAGWEQYMRDLGAAFAGDRPPTSEEVARIASRYDFHPV